MNKPFLICSLGRILVITETEMKLECGDIIHLHRKHLLKKTCVYSVGQEEQPELTAGGCARQYMDTVGGTRCGVVTVGTTPLSEDAVRWLFSLIHCDG